jgi:hypothetical protein
MENYAYEMCSILFYYNLNLSFNNNKNEIKTNEVNVCQMVEVSVHIASMVLLSMKRELVLLLQL